MYVEMVFQSTLQMSAQKCAYVSNVSYKKKSIILLYNMHEAKNKFACFTNFTVDCSPMLLLLQLIFHQFFLLVYAIVRLTKSVYTIYSLFQFIYMCKHTAYCNLCVLVCVEYLCGTNVTFVVYNASYSFVHHTSTSRRCCCVSIC